MTLNPPNETRDSPRRMGERGGEGGSQSLGKTTRLRVLQVPILKATLTLPGEKAHFRRALSPRASKPTGGTSQWLKISVQDWGTQLSGRVLA